MTSRSQDDAVEFRAGTLNDLLEVAKGGRPEAAADAKRLRSMAIGGGVSSAVLAIALVVVLLTGGGGKGNTTTTSTTLAPIAAPYGYRTTKAALADSRVPSGVKPGSKIGFTDGEATVDDVVVLAVNSSTTKIAGTESVRVVLDIAVKQENFDAYTHLNKQTLQAFGGEGPATPPPSP